MAFLRLRSDEGVAPYRYMRDGKQFVGEALRDLPQATTGSPYKQISAEILFSLPMCVIMGLRNASPAGRGGGEADGEGSTVRKEPSHPLSRELSQRESLWTRSCNFRGMGFALYFCNTKAKLVIKQYIRKEFDGGVRKWIYLSNQVMKNSIIEFVL